MKKLFQLLKKGGVNACNYLGCYGDIYFCYENGLIEATIPTSVTAKMLKQFGTELHLSDRSEVLSWKDAKSPYYGFSLKQPYLSENPCVLFATEQQTRSAQAAAMISQIREQGKDIYGELSGDIVIKADSYCGGITIEADGDYGILLRFNSRQQAERFFNNNTKLVKEYLQTF